MKLWTTGVVLLLPVVAACSGRAPHPVASSEERAARRPDSQALVLAARGRAQAKILVPPRLLLVDAPPPVDSKTGKPAKVRRSYKAQVELVEARSLLAAVRDLERYLSQISGARIEVVSAEVPLEPGLSPIWIGEAAQAHFGPVGKTAPGKQGLRVVIRKDAAGLYGESDLATSYAIYELLDRLGCRWFMPGALGEEIPRRDPLTLGLDDRAIVPFTHYRGIWYADDDFKRRNRLGGTQIAAGHALEKWITKAQRDEHPDWRAQVKGAPHATRLRWSNPDVAPAIADNIRQRLAKKPMASVSISPGDGVDFDDAFDTELDAGDWDPTVNGISLTDRLLVLANRVAENLKPDQPALRLGLLAYVSYTRPPVREKVHPSVVPVIAPITYCRSHPLSDDACPGARELRSNIIGWSERAPELAFRGYAFNLAEPAAPNPMLRKWSVDLPFLFQHRVRYFQPETLPNFETSLPALWLAIRLSWDANQPPAEILRELFDRFYGHASRDVRAYVDWVDHAWTDTAEYSGGGLGYEQRFTAEWQQRARQLMDRSMASAQTPPERERVAMLDESLSQLELYLQMSRNLRQGKLLGLASDYARWQARATELADRYAPNSAFGKTGWGGPSGVYGVYVKRFLEPIYLEADRIGREELLVTSPPLCRFRYRLVAASASGVVESPARLEAGDPATDACTETWSTLGQHDFFGAMWYSAEFDVQGLARDRTAHVWLSRVDGEVRAWLNDQPLRLRGAESSSAETHLKGLTFDATGTVQPSARNRLTLLIKRTRLAELGAGGLLGPVYVYGDRSRQPAQIPKQLSGR